MNLKSTPPAFEIPAVLYSYEQFKAWYLARTDLSMFSEEDIQGLIDEIKPVSYPCIPVCKMGDIEIIIYLHPEEMDTWHASMTQIREQVKYSVPTTPGSGK